MFIILIETSGNQRYIFSTNKLRENVGASELTYQIGTKIVREVINGKSGVEEIITTSGKALLLADDEPTAKEIVREVTKRALIEMPGLTVHGAICKIENDPNKSEAKNLDDAIGNVHRRLKEIRHQIPSNLQRFQRLPFVAECNTSNLPAEKLYRHKVVEKVEDEKPHSIVSIFKQEALFEGKQRLENTIRNAEKEIYQVETPSLFQFANNPHKLDVEARFKNTKWFAVIHADGNGLGKIFLDFQNMVKAKDKDEYCKKYASFSDGLDKCTENAAAFALKNLQTEYKKNQKDKIEDKEFEVPAIPLVLGGDDMTIICDGQYAINFTKDFLTKFVEETKKPKIQDMFPNGIDLGICAGIAIIKPHYPFHQAYHLAEQLLQSAKKSKEVSTSLSALDYHVLYDSSGVDLDEIRGKFKDFKVARPYIVSNEEDLKSFANDAWVKYRKFSELQTRVETMLKEEDGKRNIPSSQLHTLRERLHLGTDEANAFAKTIAHRYDKPEKNDEPFKKLYVDKEKGKESLFFEEKDENEKDRKITHFLDAMEIAEFWEGFPKPKKNNGGAK